MCTEQDIEFEMLLDGVIILQSASYLLLKYLENLHNQFTTVQHLKQFHF